MRKRIGMYVMAAALGAGLLAGCAMYQDREQPPTSLNEMMKMYEKLNAPGPEHARFKDAVGTWKTETKMWMGPGEPSVFNGTSKMDLVFDGRYLKEQYRCLMMEKPFEGLGLLGYDNHKKKYVSIWLDNLSTGIIMTKGTRDEATKTTTMMGEYDDPLMGPVKMKNVIRELSKDNIVFETYRIGPDGKERKEMEITYTRE